MSTFYIQIGDMSSPFWLNDEISEIVIFLKIFPTKQYLSSMWMVQTVDDMRRKTKRNVVRGDAEESEDEDNNLTPSGAAEPVQPSGVGGGGNGEDGGGGGEGANPAAVHPGRRGDDEEAVDGLFPDTATVSAMETRINCNSAFHGFKKVNTKISSCQVCIRRLLQFAAAVHCHVVHKEHTGDKMNK